MITVNDINLFIDSLAPRATKESWIMWVCSAGERKSPSAGC